MYIGKTPTVGNFQVCDAISVVNGQAAYTLQVGGVNVAPESANHMLVSLNGILQKPGSSFTISGSTMTFASNLATGDVIDFVQILGNVLDIGQPSDDTVTAAKLNNDIISGQTALTSSPDDTDELLISDAGTIKRIDYSYLKAANTPAFAATRTSNQSASSANAITKVQADVEIFDTDSAYDNSTNYRFTPQVAGKYLIYAKLYMDSSDHSATSKVVSNIYKNGSNYSSYQLDFRNNYGGYDNSVMNQAVIDMNGSSDYVEAYFQIVVNSGTGLLAAGTKSNEFGGYKLIGV
mgnify:CR=1 FL=1